MQDAPLKQARSCQIWLGVGAPILVLVLIVIVAALTLFWGVAKRQDRDFAVGHQTLVSSAIEGGARALSNTTVDFAFWNAAYSAISVRWDGDWLEANYVSAVADGLVVFGADAGVRYVWFSELEGEAAVAVAEAAARATNADDLRAATASKSAASFNSFALADGQLIGVSVAPVSRESEEARRQPGATLDFVASIDILSEEELAERGGALGLRDLAFTTAPAQGGAMVSIPVLSAAGANLGFLTWRNERPGSAGFARQMWPIAIGLLLIGALAILTARRLVSGQITAMAHAEAAFESSRVKSEFIATMSHELRTPLNAIIGYSELIGEQVSPGDENETDIRTDAGRIATAARHLLQLINGILDHSRVDAERESLAVEAIDVRHILAEVEEVATSLAKARGNALTFTAGPGATSVLADPLRLRQCLLNLVGNATKFTQAGTVEVYARLATRKTGAFVAFEVRDTGVGIDAAAISRLFAPFVQANASITREYGGSGLGLSITRKLARAMGGDVDVVSEAGKGSTFTLFIPAAPGLRLVA